MDCRYCEIQVEITKRAYAARCPNPVAVLEYIREKMKGSTRPRVDIADMKRATAALAPEGDMTNKQTTEPEADALTTAAKAIGTTLGRIAVKTGIAKPEAVTSAPVPRVKKATAKKKAPAAKLATDAKRRTVSRKSVPPAKAKKPAVRKKG